MATNSGYRRLIGEKVYVDLAGFYNAILMTCSVKI